ncbi:MAG: serine/threonine-protein kinase [Actinomycetota bacterium]
MSAPKPSWRFRPGEVVDGRAIEACLGGGSTYEVYAATVLSRFGLAMRSEIGKERMVVVKYLRPHVVSNERSLIRLRRETRLVQRLHHSDAVRLVDAVLEGPRPHLVLERVPGPSLRARLREGPIPIDEAIALGARLADQLAYLAHRHVVHLDVKPSNVIFGPRPTLIDFSVAREISAAARLTKPVGTDIWMAPEQCVAGKGGAIGSAADVWGLGTTLWRALLGKPPFKRLSDYDRNDPLQRFPQLSSRPRPLPPHVPPAFGSLLVACLRVEASSRPTSEELAEALAALQPVAA